MSENIFKKEIDVASKLEKFDTRTNSISSDQILYLLNFNWRSLLHQNLLEKFDTSKFIKFQSNKVNKVSTHSMVNKVSTKLKTDLPGRG